MIETGIDRKIKIQDIVYNQLPKYILDESPLTVDFLKQYYISQEYQGGPVDIAENLDEYLKLDNLTPDVVVESTTTVGIATIGAETIEVTSTKGFPNQYGLLKIDNEVITYTGITTDSFTGCIRGFSGITSYHQQLNQEELIFSDSEASSHNADSQIQNLSSLFLKEFYKKKKYTFTPGLENNTFNSKVDAGNFIKESKSLYATKGTDESFRILFNVLFDTTPQILNLEERLIKPSSANYSRRRVGIAEIISGNPLRLKGQSIFKSDVNTDINTSISEIEPFSRSNSGNTGVTTYYKVSLFVGYDETNDIEGDFTPIPNSRSLETVPIDSSIISVDSTVGFNVSGTLNSGINVITYTDKTVNQFLNCTWIGDKEPIKPIDTISSDQYYYSYEDGDTNKLVKMRFTNVISDIEIDSKITVSENDIISVKTIGDEIKNPTNPTFKEFFANSWIYNTSSTYFMENVGNISKLSSKIDESSLKKGDYVEITDRETNQIVYPTEVSNKPFISDEPDLTNNTVKLQNLSEFIPNPNRKYNLRRKIDKSSSSGTPLQFGNDNIISNVQNVYTNKEYAYVASNSLPSTITDTTVSVSGIGITLGSLFENKYSTIYFNNDHNFKIGDKVYYEPEGDALVGLNTGFYYINPVGLKGIKIYGSSSAIEDNKYIDFTLPPSNNLNHKFILYSQKSDLISPQKLLKKFPLNLNISNGTGKVTNNGSTGLLIDGTEIVNYKSTDKVYYGPLESISILNGGDNYDVINPPNITVAAGLGVTALVQPVMSGKIKEILVDPYDYDIDNVISIGVTGGNGSGCVLKPIIAQQYREILFNADTINNGGGINTVTEQILFLNEHGLIDGEPIIYDTNFNSELGVGIGTSKLVSGSVYYPSISNTKTIKLYNNFSDYSVGINTIDFNGSSGSGIQKFKLSLKNKLSSIEVLDGGNGYTNRKLTVNPSGISTETNTITFKNHGFKDGDIVEYSTNGNIIGGITNYTFKVVKVDDNSFKLTDVGIGATITSNYERKKFVNFTSTGTGYQYFSYPEIKAYIKSTSTAGITSSLELTPVVKGGISDIYLYENGTGYGSTIKNAKKSPIITITTGRDAALTPFFINGQLNMVSIDFGGFDYYSTPELEVIDPTGSGSGVKLRPIISNNKIVDVKIINRGIGYSNTYFISVKSSGSGALFDINIRPLTINQYKYFESNNTITIDSKSILVESDNNLKYSLCGYDNTTFDDTNPTTRSSIIGWAYDGNPIYGPYANANPEENKNENIKRLESGYELDISNVIDRPPLEEGYFVEDYKFTNTGDLDEHNGRYEVNSDFPNGVYAYHAVVDNLDKPLFPYFIGNSYRSNPLDDNFSTDDQSTIDLNQLDYLRNTFPYKVSDSNANNDFIIETDELMEQEIKIESVVSGSINGIDIINSGENCKVDDIINFDNSGTEGVGLIAKVSEIEGKSINSVDTSIESFDNSIITWSKNSLKFSVLPRLDLSHGDIVNISGISTNLLKLEDSYNIGITSFSSVAISTIKAASLSESTSEIFVSRIPDYVSVGSSIMISSESLKVLNIYRDLNALTVQRDSVSYGNTYDTGTTVSFIPDSFTINESVPYFESERNDMIYFNPSKSVGLGTTAGLENKVSLDFAGNTITRNIPVKQIYIEDHPFRTNQKINFTIPTGGSSIAISTDTSNITFNLPATAYVVNKGKNTIGIKTGLGPSFDEVYFRSFSSPVANADKDTYSFEGINNKIIADVNTIKTTVSVSTSHELVSGDLISLNINPNLSVGIGTLTSIKVLRETNSGNILINPIQFTSGSVKHNKLGLGNHGFKTGDKVFYDGDATGLSTGSYYVYKIDDNFIQLGETLYDVNNTIKTVPITEGTGSSQSISKINPQISSIKNNNLVFDLSDSSLNGYSFNVYYDQEFKNKFNSVGLSPNFNISQVGTSLTVGYSTSLPQLLYYSLEKSGFISTADTEVLNYSEISFVDSKYDGNYSISGVGTTTFQIYLDEVPEKLSYNPSECDSINYSTNSKNAKGGIKDIDIISGGSGYKDIPTFVGVGSMSLKNDVSIVPTSDNIGNIKEIRIVNNGFEYSYDKTLKPQAYISPIVETKNSNKLGIVSVTSSGANYLTPPNIVVVDYENNTIVNSGYIEPILLEGSITNLDVQEVPVGLPESKVVLRAINNSNGINIESIQSSAGTAFTCIITTPINGFLTNPLSIGDKVFVEGIEKYSNTGSGFNSSDYNYELLTISNYESTNPDKVTIDVSEFTSNTGIAKTTPTNYCSLISENDYPAFTFSKEKSLFSTGEFLIVNNQDTDLKITESNLNYIKIYGTYNLSINDSFEGKISRNKAINSDIKDNKAEFKTDFSVLENVGWNDSVGKLSDETQVLPNNDYYQNLSYSIKSPIQWNEMQPAVNNILHTSGMKNFSDSGISSTANIGIDSKDSTEIIYDVIGENRVDVKKDVDLVVDSDTTNNSSRFISFDELRLSDYIRCISNEVLSIDDISDSFSNLNSDSTEYLNLDTFSGGNLFTNYLFRINNIDGSEFQLSEIIIVSNDNTNILFEKSNIINSNTSLPEDNIADFTLFNDSQTQLDYLRFTPKNTLTEDYDLKILSHNYNSSTDGIGTYSIGPINISSFIGTVTSGQTNPIISLPSNKFESIHATTHVIDTITNKINFVETYVTHDGSNTFIAEYYVDTDNSVISTNKIGILEADLSTGVFSLSYQNNTPNLVKLQSKIVGFGTTGISDNTYRFLSQNQPPGSERSVIYQGISTFGVGITTIVELDKDLFNSVKSTVEVSIGSSKAVHEVLSLHDGGNVYVQQSQSLSVDHGSNTEYDPGLGLGTFGGKYDGNNFIVSFYPDNLSGVSTVKTLNQCFYTKNDKINDPLPLTYGKSKEDIEIKEYNAIGGKRINRTEFEAQYNSIPIFGKSFNPSDTNVVDFVTGKFTIENHYFSENEELIYRPKSTFVGVGSTPMMYNNPVDNVVGTLPSNIFVKTVHNNNSFTISTTRSGIAVTFIDDGEGNAHEFIMSKANEKSLIIIDNVAQSPISRTDITHTLKNNIGNIGVTTNIISLSGITTLTTNSILKIDNEYVKVVNVGFGTTSTGPLSTGIGTFNLIEVERSVLGSDLETHNNSSVARLYKGSYNIVGKNINFIDAPRGNPVNQFDNNNLKFPTADFNGRAYLRQNYDSNVIYDDISENFNGITTSFALTVGGGNTIGIGSTGRNGILFINGIFQSPSTDNNPDNNFKIVENSNAGTTDVVFSGITSSNSEQFISDIDPNVNQLPRGGVPVSIGNTVIGLGYAPLIGAVIRPILDANGSITSIVGVATTGDSLGINTAVYDGNSGIVTITTIEPHNFVFGDQYNDEVKLVGLYFTCPANSGVTTNFFPSGAYGDKFSVVSVSSTNTFSAQVGTSTIPHTYVGFGTVFPWYGNLTYGSGYNDSVSIDVTVIDYGYDHKFVSSNNNSINVVSGGSQLTPSDAEYNPTTGIVTFTVSNHQLSTNDLITLDDNSLIFTCSKDGHLTEHSYPRSTDPVSGIQTTITKVTDDIFNIFVGTNVGEGANITASPAGIGSNTHNWISASSDAIEIVYANNAGLIGSNLQPQPQTTYDPDTGILFLKTATHGLINGDIIKLKNNSIVFTCAQDDHATEHSYPRGGLEHKFVSATSTAVNGSLQPINAVYSGDTGYMTLTFASAHGISNGATISIADNSITMTCAKDAHATEHTYPRSTDPISVGGGSATVSNATANSGKDLTVYVGRSGLSDPIAGISTSISNVGSDTFTINVGKSTNHHGGALRFNIVGAGQSYKSPRIFVSEPSYNNLPIIGVSRRGVGSTTETGKGFSMNISVGGTFSDSELYGVSEFDVIKSGYSFKIGDVFKPVGLVTDRRIREVSEEFNVEVTEIYNDSFSAWQFGEFDYIDTISQYQDGERVRFPLYYDNTLISVEADNSLDCPIENLFLITINGIIQDPSNYEILGGTSLRFKTAPLKDDNVSIFFYKGTDDVDAIVTDADRSVIEVGDEVQIKSINNNTFDQDKRTVISLDTSKKLETNVYTGIGINEIVKKPIDIINQKTDKFINNVLISKKRISLEPLVFPTSRIIKDFSTSDTSFYVDNAELFRYGGDDEYDAIISAENITQKASATATILNGQVDGVSITDNGDGYISQPTISFAAPPSIGVGVGTTATATLSVTNGTITFGALTNPGLGYTIAPKVLIEEPKISYEVVEKPLAGTISVQSTSGIITGITTSMSGSNLCLTFTGITTDNMDPITVGNPIYIYDTHIGSGVTSTDSSDTNIIGLGTSFLDNVYIVKEFSKSGVAPNIVTGIITCTIKSNTDTTGWSVTGTDNVGKFSVGKISGFDRSNSPISIGVTGRTISGLSTFPLIQRRGGNDTFEKTGALITPI